MQFNEKQQRIIADTVWKWVTQVVQTLKNNQYTDAEIKTTLKSLLTTQSVEHLRKFLSDLRVDDDNDGILCKSHLRLLWCLYTKTDFSDPSYEDPSRRIDFTLLHILRDHGDFRGHVFCDNQDPVVTDSDAQMIKRIVYNTVDIVASLRGGFERLSEGVRVVFDGRTGLSTSIMRRQFNSRETTTAESAGTSLGTGALLALSVVAVPVGLVLSLASIPIALLGLPFGIPALIINDQINRYKPNRGKSDGSAVAAGGIEMGSPLDSVNGDENRLSPDQNANNNNALSSITKAVQNTQFKELEEGLKALFNVDCSRNIRVVHRSLVDLFRDNSNVTLKDVEVSVKIIQSHLNRASQASQQASSSPRQVTTIFAPANASPAQNSSAQPNKPKTDHSTARSNP